MLRRARPPLLVLLVTLLLGGCSGGGDELPAGGELLTRSADAMAAVQTARFTLGVEGTLAGFPVQGAQGQLTREGDAAGTVTLDQGGRVAELEFVLTGDSLYLQGPTGGFQELPAALAGSVYDPSAILDPERGLAALLRGGSAATTEAREEVGGVDAYRVRATFPGTVLGGLIPGVAADTTGQVWIATADDRLVQARFRLPEATATVQLSDFDAPADIAPPP